MSIDRDIIINKGATFSTTFSVSGDLAAATTACFGRWQHGAATAVWSGTVAAVHSGNQTTFTITIPAATTAALAAPVSGVWDMETTLAGVTTRQIQGSFYITPEVCT